VRDSSMRVRRHARVSSVHGTRSDSLPIPFLLPNYLFKGRERAGGDEIDGTTDLELDRAL